MSKNTKIKDILDEFKFRIDRCYNSNNSRPKSKLELQQHLQQHLILHNPCTFGVLSIEVQQRILNFMIKTSLNNIPYFYSDDFEKIKFLFVNRDKVYKILNIDDKE